MIIYLFLLFIDCFNIRTNCKVLRNNFFINNTFNLHLCKTFILLNLSINLLFIIEASIRVQITAINFNLIAIIIFNQKDSNFQIFKFFIKWFIYLKRNSKLIFIDGLKKFVLNEEKLILSKCCNVYECWLNRVLFLC